MATIVLIEDEDALRRLVTQVLEDHDVETFSDVPSALTRLESGDAPALVIADIALGSGPSGFDLRDAMLADTELEAIPFMFLTGADETSEVELGKRLETEVVSYKPINVPAFRRLVDSLLGDSERDAGRLDTQGLATLLRRIGRAEMNAVLTAYNGEVAKRLTFRGGRLIFAISNDPSELIGQALIREGLVSERELANLFQNRGTGVPIGEVYLAKAGGRSDALMPLLQRKIREAVLDLFLWTSEAAFELVETVEHAPFETDLDPEAILEEGLERARLWRRVQPMLPGPDTAFEVSSNGIPDYELKTPGAQLLASLLMDDHTIREIELEVRGQRYFVGVKIAEWLTAGYIKPAPGYTLRRPTAPPVFREAVNSTLSENGERSSIAANPSEETTPATPPSAEPTSQEVSAALAEALALFRKGELRAARAQLAEVLDLAPANSLARMRLREIDEQLAAEARALGVIPARQVVLVNDPPIDHSFSGNENFVLARISGSPLTVEDLVHLSPMTEPEIMKILLNFISLGLIKIV